MMSAQAPLFKKWYSLFSEYEKENGGIINNKFLQYQEVPDSWVNRAMQLRRYFSVSDVLTYLGYNSSKIDVVLNCLETVKK